VCVFCLTVALCLCVCVQFKQFKCYWICNVVDLKIELLSVLSSISKHLGLEIVFKACERTYLTLMKTFCCSLIVSMMEIDYFDLKLVDFIWFYCLSMSEFKLGDLVLCILWIVRY
jgi:hypothetical protein